MKYIIEFCNLKYGLDWRRSENNESCGDFKIFEEAAAEAMRQQMKSLIGNIYRVSSIESES